ncbi:MAG: glutamine amidotransferase [Alicyclobacillus herbarius]|uniref:type 1 glutamine amidotransferase n=1 Tax=Alicyclobacillus herbarius TaxID=122960 RepID=UPI000411BD72|nr:glutamine amidotransferase [Alicyclobacillus herbarius]MCL6631557.1 glutamine amidotransferase [Alicyclobacillus herbarius]
MPTKLRIAHLYPDLLNLYADKGNIRVLVQRCRWRGIETEVIPVPSGEEPRLEQYHLVLLGGGSDREQELVAKTLGKNKLEWRQAVHAGLPVLAVCGGYQLLGEYYQLPDGRKVAGLELLDLVTKADGPRLIGNIAIDAGPELGTIVGFENHGGRTRHGHEPLGTVLKGHGNNGRDGKEGVRYQNVIGTYIHGPLLPKNPRLADHMLQLALDYAGIRATLAPLDDAFEMAAHHAFLSRRLDLPTG